MASQRHRLLYCIVLLLMRLGVLSAQPFALEKIAFGAIFDQNTEEIQNVFKYAMTQHNQNITSRGRLEFQAYVDVINTADAFKLSRLICNQFARGVWSMLGAVTPDSFDTLHSYTNTFQMPFVTPWFPEKVIPPSSGLIDHAVSMRPDYHKAVVDTIMHYGWKEIIYMYDSHDGENCLSEYVSLCIGEPTCMEIPSCSSERFFWVKKRENLLTNPLLRGYNMACRKYKIPGIVGAVDGTHVCIIRPNVREKPYFNRKGYHFLNINDSDLKIICVDPSPTSSTHDNISCRTHPLHHYLNDTFDTERLSLLGSNGHYISSGLLRLQQLYQLMQPGRTAFRISLVKRITNATDALEFLLALEQYDRWGTKRIVLDSNAKNVKNILVGHVRNVHLGRRTYHYILSGLVMDDHWENEIIEYGAVNITGFRIMDHSRKIVRDFMDGLRRMEPRAKDTISAQAALMYDGVQVLIDALGRLWRKKPDAFRNAMRRGAGQQANATKVIDCNPGKSWVVPFEHGDKISRLIKKTDIEGLTGNISFNEEGHRHNFTLHIVEMTVQSAMLKVATWSDKYGFMPTSPRFVPLRSPGSYDANKTYVITTILHEPYMMQKPLEPGQPEKDKFYGLCKDLFVLLAQELGIKYELRLVKDGKYGSESITNEWSGLVGELVRKEADMALAPLAVTEERGKFIDFTEPYISIDYAVKLSRNPKQLSDTFSFLRPLSKEIWLCVIFSFFAVSIVLFLVSRFSPREWRSISVSDTHVDHPISSTNEIILHNDFSIWNSFWFSLGSFMQQGSDVVPRSLSGRIVGTVWWFFALILVCSYTANLAAYLIVERIAEPTQNLNYPTSLIAHSEVERVILQRNLNEDPPITSEDLKHVHYTIDENGQFICNAGPVICRNKHVNFAIATTKGSPLREGINIALVNLKKNGVLAKLLRKWLVRSDHHDCSLHKNEENSVTEMTLGQVAGIFYVLVGGLVVALGVALLEFCQHGRAEAARSNVTLRAALKAKARIASRKDQKQNHNGVTREHERLNWNGTPFGGYYAGANQISQEDAVHASYTHV